MFGRIVVGTRLGDGQRGRRAGDRAAKLLGAKLEIVSAFEPTGRLAPEPLHVVHPRDVSLSLDSAAGEARKEGLEVQTHPREGDPADAIIDVAEETAADLIVVGNKGMTGSSAFCWGASRTRFASRPLRRVDRSYDLEPSLLAPPMREEQERPLAVRSASKVGTGRGAAAGGQDSRVPPHSYRAGRSRP